MSNLAKLIFICSFAFVAIAVAGDQSASDQNQPESPAALAAIHDYEKATKAADDAWKAAAAAADRKLVEKLNVAIKVATRAGNLGEANRIDVEIKRAAARMEREHAPTRSEGPAITSWTASCVPIGMEKQAVDVTELVRKCVKENYITNLGEVHFPDPGPGATKIILINGAYGGKPFTLRVFAGQLGSFYFGIPNPKEKLSQ